MALMRRFFVDEAGGLRPGRLYPAVVVCIVLALLGTVLLTATPVLKGHETLQGIYVLFCVFLLKLPLVFLLWWLIMRNREWPGMRPEWSSEETEEILAYLMSQARLALGREDEIPRLTYLSTEAWNVADQVNGHAKVDALTVALRIDERLTFLHHRQSAPPPERP